MRSRFFNGFLVFFYPDSIFKYTKKAESAFEPLISLLLFAGLSMALGLKLIHTFQLYQLNMSFFTALLIVFTIFFVFILLNAAVSGLLDWIYSFGVKMGKKNISSDFLGSFCCHAYILPVWIFLVSMYLFLPDLKKSHLFEIGAVLLMIRLLDIEARLLKAVYGFRLIQSYVLVFLQLLCIVFGASLAYFSRDIIRYFSNT